MWSRCLSPVVDKEPATQGQARVVALGYPAGGSNHPEPNGRQRHQDMNTNKTPKRDTGP